MARARRSLSRTAALALAVGACGRPAAPDPPPLPAGPSCERAYEATWRSLAELHRAAGRPLPSPPDRDRWIATCRAAGLAPEQLACLEPERAAADPDGCAARLPASNRAPLDQPFLDTMLATEEEP